MSLERYYVYVVELRPHTTLDDRSPRGPVYVGSSALPPHERLAHHRRGGREASRHVYRYGVRLLPRLYKGINPLSSREAAKIVERRLARNLANRGYSVHGSCSPMEKQCVL